MDSTSEQLNYKRIPRSHPSYFYSKITPDEGSSITASSSGGSTITFAIPSNICINLYRTELAFYFNPPASGAGVYNWVFKNSHIFSAIQLFADSGIQLVDLAGPGEANELFRVVKPFITKKDDLLEADCNASGGSKSGEFFRPNNIISTNVAAARYDNSAPSRSYIEHQYLEVGTANTADPILYVKIKLGDLVPHSFLELDKNIILPEALTLSLTVAPSSRIYYTGTTNSNATTGATAGSGNMSLGNITLFLCKEMDPEVVRDVYALFAGGGIPLQFEWCRIEKATLSAAATSKSQQSKINRNLGTHIKRIYSTVANITQSSNTAFDINNLSDNKVLEFYTTLDNQRLIADWNIDTSDQQDYSLLKSKGLLKDSCILDANIYQYNWCWVDSWEGVSLCDRDNLYSNKILGKEIGYEMIHSTEYPSTANAQHILYKFIIVAKTMNISKNGGFVIFPTGK